MDNLIDVTTGDYSGSQTTTVINAAYLRLVTPLASYWADPLLGSRLYELEREKDLTRVYKLARQYAEQALQPLIDDGRARSITITTEQIKKNWLYLHIEILAGSGDVTTFTHPVKVN